MVKMIALALDGPTITLTLAQLLTDVGTVLSALLGWMIDIFNTALSSPIVLVFIVMALIGTAVAFTRKLLNN